MTSPEPSQGMEGPSCHTSEGFVTVHEGHKLYTKTWTPSIPRKAAALFLHGFSDHINRFEWFFNTLAQQGIQVFGFDQRGWGRSVSKKTERGQTGPTQIVMDDIASMVNHLLPDVRETSTPLFLMGHSMGGAEVLYFAATMEENLRRRIRGFLAFAPLIRLHPSSQPFKLTILAGKAAKLVFPNMHMVQKLKPQLLCRDEEICKQWENDQLCHNTGTLEGLGGMLDRAEELDLDKVVLRDVSVFLAHGTSDFVTSHDASSEWMNRLAATDKDFRSYVGCYHVLHMEPSPHKETFASDVADWVLKRSKD